MTTATEIKNSLFLKLAALYTDANAGLLSADAATTLCRAISDEMKKLDSARTARFLQTGDAEVKDFGSALAGFIAVAQEKIDAEHADTVCANPQLSTETGRRYVRIVRTLYRDPTNRSVFCFVDTTNGNVLKAAGWKAPAKHARGNIYADDNGAGAVNAYGARYL